MLNFRSICLREIQIVPFTKKHITDRYVSWLNDPLTVQFSEQRHCRHTKQTCLAYYRRMKRSKHLFLAIETLTPARRHVGNISVEIDYPNQRGDQGILIGDAHARGRGIGYQSWNAVLLWLLQSGQIRMVTAGAMRSNHPMVHIFEKSGMKIQAIREGYFMLNNKAEDLVLACKQGGL